MELTWIDIVMRLGVATVLAALIGMEREWHEKPAGIRTNVMVGLGSAIMTLAGIRAVELFSGVIVDPTRIAAQIVTGIGFIGAGAILRPGKGNVIGLTTAATLWVVSGLGIAVGFGLYLEAIVATAFVFFTFFVLGKLVKAIRHHRELQDIKHGPLNEEGAVQEREDTGENE